MLKSGEEFPFTCQKCSPAPEENDLLSDEEPLISASQPTAVIRGARGRKRGRPDDERPMSSS